MSGLIGEQRDALVEQRVRLDVAGRGTRRRSAWSPIAWRRGSCRGAAPPTNRAASAVLRAHACDRITSGNAPRGMSSSFVSALSQRSYCVASQTAAGRASTLPGRQQVGCVGVLRHLRLQERQRLVVAQRAMTSRPPGIMRSSRLPWYEDRVEHDLRRDEAVDDEALAEQLEDVGQRDPGRRRGGRPPICASGCAVPCRRRPWRSRRATRVWPNRPRSSRRPGRRPRGSPRRSCCR